MRFVRRTAEYFCVKCFATGRLPVVEGDACCPECGEPVWTVRQPVYSVDAAKPITPDYRLPIHVYPPAMRMRGRWLARFCVRLVPSRVGRWLARRDERANAQVSALLQQLQTCRSRAEFEAVLGKPVYAVSGKGCGTLDPDGRIRNEPDVIEHYDCGCCSIDLSFQDDRLQEKWGYMRLAPLYLEYHRQRGKK